MLRRKKPLAAGGGGTEEVSPFALYPDAARQTLALVTLLGVERGQAARMVLAAQEALQQFDRLVFVLSAPDLSAATRAGAVVELLPGPREIAGQDAVRLRSYMTARHDQILRKWQPDYVLEYGCPLDDHIAGLIVENEAAAKNQF